MAEEEFLDWDLPPGDRPPDDRYSARDNRPPWTAREELVLFAVLPYCGSRAIYAEACRFLLNVLGRLPSYAPSARPTQAEYLASCISIVERRTVTAVMARERHETVQLAEEISCNHRAGVPWSWAEEVEFVTPWWKRLREGKEYIDEDELLMLLGRGENEARDLTAELRRIAAPNYKEPNPNRRADPCLSVDRGELRNRILPFVTDASEENWLNLVTYLTERNPS